MLYEVITNVVRQISNNMFLASATTLMLIHGGIDLSQGAVVSLTSVMCVSFIVTMGRITSYNVCYTKLLRNIVSGNTLKSSLTKRIL